MSFPVHIYQELMNDSELSFLKEKEQKERRVFTRTVRNLSVLFIIIPCCLGIIMESVKRSSESAQATALREQEDPYVYQLYVFGMFFLLLIVCLGSYYSYTRTLKRLVRDIRSGYKTVEQTHIDRKHFVEANNTYHFYLKSTFRLSVEVSKEDFDAYREGDEINIEYSTFSRIYFGYF